MQIGGVELVEQARAPEPAPTRPSSSCRSPSRSQPGATIEVAFKFTAQLPEVFARTGYKGEFHMVGQWFPKIGVRVGPPGAERWECQPFHVNTEFFADFGTYDVTLTVPSTHVVAATGVLVERDRDRRAARARSPITPRTCTTSRGWPTRTWR